MQNPNNDEARNGVAVVSLRRQNAHDFGRFSRAISGVLQATRNPAVCQTVCVSSNPPGPTVEVSVFSMLEMVRRSGAHPAATVTKDGCRCPAMRREQAGRREERRANTAD